MIGRATSFLGIAISDRAIACAEVASSGGDRRVVRRTATYALPDGVTLESPEAVGQALATFLRSKSFGGTSRCVVGLPARWLIAVEREIPPSNEEEARAALRLQAERLAVAESGEVVFDFAGLPRRNEVVRVLLVGMLRQRLENVERMMESARLNVAAITSTGLALAACAAARNGDGGVLTLAQGGGELVWRSAGSPRMLRHVPFTLNGHGVPPTLGNELRRMMAMMPMNGSPNAVGGASAAGAKPQAAAARTLLLLDEVGLEDHELSELSQRLGVAVTNGAARDVLGVEAAAVAPADLDDEQTTATGRFAPAMALALAGARPELLPLDFKHSRLKPLKVHSVGRRSVWAIAIGVTALVAIVALWLNVRSRQAELDSLETQIKAMKPDVTSAQAIVDRLSVGRGYFETRPPVLDCLRELTTAFRDDEKLWASTFTLAENGKGTLVGRAADQKTVLDLLARLKKNPRFGDVKLPGGMREADARSREVSFSMSFDFKNVE